MRTHPHPFAPVRTREVLGVLAGFSVLTLALTYPQVLEMSTAIGWHYDAYFSVWRLAWIAHQLRTDPLHLFDANIFYPEARTLTYSDAVLLQGALGAPLVWMGVAPVVVYNLLVLLSFVTAGAAMYALARSLGSTPGGAWVAGLVFAFQPYRFAHYPQIELLWSCWIPLAFLALHETLDRPSLRAGVRLGLFVAMQALSCLYYAVFLITGLAIVAVVLVVGERRQFLQRLVKPAAVAVTLCLLLVGPYAMAYVSGGRGARSEQEVLDWSPRLVNYLAAPNTNWLYGKAPTSGLNPLEGMLFPGLAAVVLSAIGAARAPRRVALAYALLLIVAFDLSLGFNGWLYRAFYDWVPLFDGLRVPARLVVMVSAAMAVLAALGITWMRARLAHHRSELVSIAFAAVVVVESLSVPLSLNHQVEAAPVRLYKWLAQQPRSPIVEWPLPPTSNLGFTDAPRQMYFSTWHWQPLVNGYSGYYPQSFVLTLNRTRNFPDTQAMRELQRIGIRYLVLHSLPSPEDYVIAREKLTARPEVRFLFTDQIGSEELALYELRHD